MASSAETLTFAPPTALKPAPTPSPGFSEICGNWLGKAVRPLVAWTTKLRHGRTFHPHGEVLVGHFEPSAEDAQDAELSQRLTGHVLVRFSDALAQHGPQRFDVLGCALRFALEESISHGVQDLLFATIARPWTMPLSPFTTDTSDFLANDYFAVSPFRTSQHARIWLRLRPHPEGTSTSLSHGAGSPPSAEERRRALVTAIADEALQLELACAKGPYGPWRRWGSVVVDRLLDEDPAELAFDPFANAAGIVPRGFIHALRRGIYARGQAARRANAARPRSSTVIQGQDGRGVV